MEIEVTRRPKISVVMSVYNGDKYLHEAIESIINQSLDDFEFIIINDASTDASVEIIESFKDSRILVITNETNLGLTKSLNIGIGIAKGEFIARMDADDISMPARLLKQVQYLDQYPDISFCGTQVSYSNNPKGNATYPLTHECLKVAVMAANPFAHASIIWRRTDFINNNLYYNESFLVAQDYELWSRAIMKLKAANLPERLLFYRVHDEQVGKKRILEQNKNALQIQLSFLDALGIMANEDQKKWHSCIFGNGLSEYRTLNDLKSIENWLKYLLTFNEKKNVFNNNCLIDYWAKKVYTQGLYHNSIPIWIWSRKSIIGRATNVTKSEKIRFLVKSLIGKRNK